VKHHHVFNLALDGKLVFAPIKNPQRVLDAGTGTGIWAIDFAEYVHFDETL
jgi:ubiquinone/menaquinone biosynthesis C-methylase UbiE